MNFKQRLLRYLLGFGIGVVVVFIMFPQYDWLGWTPGKRVMQHIRETGFYFSETGLCKMECAGINTEQVQLARSEGKIDFSKSNVKTDPKMYHLDYGNISLHINVTDSTATVIDAMKDAKSCECN